jgi:hypothetical protein
MDDIKPILAALVLAVTACHYPSPQECRDKCASAGLVVSHWEAGGGCDCADVRAPAHTEVHNNTNYHTPVQVHTR